MINPQTADDCPWQHWLGCEHICCKWWPIGSDSDVGTEWMVNSTNVRIQGGFTPIAPRSMVFKVRLQELISLVSLSAPPILPRVISGPYLAGLPLTLNHGLNSISLASPLHLPAHHWPELCSLACAWSPTSSTWSSESYASVKPVQRSWLSLRPMKSFQCGCAWS